MVELVVTSHPDPRIRGSCPIPDEDKTVPRPSKNPCNGKILAANFYKGMKVKYNGIERTIYNVNYYFLCPKCNNLIGNRIVTSLDLGAPDTNVPWYSVELFE